jgi:hypothetical protein
MRTAPPSASAFRPDDALHLVSAIWPSLRVRSPTACLDLSDPSACGVFGRRRLWHLHRGYLDFGIFTDEALGMDWSYKRTAKHTYIGLMALGR